MQVQRKAFYRVDSEYCEKDPASGKPAPMCLVHVPDGHEEPIKTAPVPPAGFASTPAPGGKSAAKKPAASASAAATSAADTILFEIETVGNAIRDMKANKASKEAIKAEVDKLLDAKARYKTTSGQEWNPQLIEAARAAQSAS